MEELVILGGTASGVGLGLASGGALILEDSCLLGAEFLASMNVKPCRCGAFSGKAAALREACLKEGSLLPDGRIYPAPIQAMLAEMLTDSQARIRFQACVLEVMRDDEGFLVRWLDCEGMHMTRSRQLAETRAFGGRKSLCVVMDKPAPESPDGRYELLFDKAGHCIVKFRLPEEATWEEARRIAHEGTARLPGRVLSVSSVFSRDYDSPVCFRREDGAQVCVSASYPDVFSAMEGGIACACVR